MHLFIDRQNKSFLKIRFIFYFSTYCFACMQVYVPATCVQYPWRPEQGAGKSTWVIWKHIQCSSHAKPSLQPQEIDSLCHKKYIKYYSTRQRQCITMTKSNWGGGWGGTDVQATEDCCLLGYSTLRITSLQGGTAHRELGPSTSITNQENEVNLGSALPH